MRKSLVFLSACTWVLLAACGVEPELRDIAPTDPRIQYIGRVDLSGAAPTFSYPGVSIKARFTGSTLNVMLRSEGKGGARGTNYFYVIIDEDAPIKVETRLDATVYEVAKDLDPNLEHMVEVYKLNESEVGSVQFLGFQIRGDMLTAAPRPNRRMEIIGDSFACAYGNDGVFLPPPFGNPTTGFTSINQNFYMSFSAIAARALGAELAGTCVSGRGMLRNNTGDTVETLPGIYNRIFPLKRTSANWEPNRYVPDVVVINLGTNDFAYQQSAPDETEFQTAYKSFVRRLRELYPNAKIVCTVGSMMSDYYPAGKQHWTLIQRYTSGVVEQLNAEGDTQVYYMAFSTQRVPYGEDWHPTIDSHKISATELTNFLKPITGW
jgi:lysophospholipase L1-like esterase